jgi:hypothetical protein
MDENVQPIEPIDAIVNSTPLSERLQNILDSLTEYHRELLLKYSHFTQSPQELIAIESLLRQKAKIIKNYLLYNKNPDNLDPKLRECLENLKQANTPWDPKISTLTDYWCDLMFIKHPFTMSHTHIKNLLNNSLEQVEKDGETADDEE